MGDRLVIGGQLGDYLIDSVIGRGGMSVVYRARHSRLGMLVALKVLAPELSADDVFRERFLREAQMAASMDHPNVIPIHDMGLHEDSLYIILRYVSGGDLKTLLSTSGPLGMTRALALLTPVGAALDAAHARGLIHRDVKPANILIQRPDGGADEHVYLTDFGIAKSASFESGLTKSGISIGTLGYMAPEQVEGKEVSAQTDVYGLAATLYECLTGRVPFRRGLAEGVHPTADELEPVSAVRPDLPSTLDAVLRRGLAKNPDDRYASCNEFLRSCWITLGDPVSPVGAAGERTPRATQPSSDAPESGEGAPPREPSSIPAPSAPGEVSANGARGGRGTGTGARRPRRKLVVAVGVPVIIAAAVAAALLASGSTNTGSSSTAALAPVPTNHVTGYGNASISLNGNQATVSVNTERLDSNAPLVHVMHIHAGGKGECPPASAAQLHHGHLTISTTNGASYYGPPVQSLTTHGDTSAASILAFPRYLSGGTLHYERTIILPAAVATEIRLNHAVIVVHGVDYDGTGIYSGVLGLSELNRSVPGTATAPALCGKLVGPPSNGASSASSNDRAVLYTASLKPSAESFSEALLCISYLREAISEEARRRGHAGASVPPERLSCRVEAAASRRPMPDRSQPQSDPLARHSLSAAELKQILAAERVGEAFIVFRDQHGTLCLFTANGRRESNIGRRSEMHLSIPWDNEISGLHAEVHHLGREWAIIDDGLSMNGTFVNGQRISGRARLRDGDRVRVGRTLLAYRAAQATLVDETVSAAHQPSLHVTDTQRRVLIALCGPYRHGGYAVPATNQEIAKEVFLGVDAVKMHLRALFARFELGALPQNQKRATLAEQALQRGVITLRDLD